MKKTVFLIVLLLILAAVIALRFFLPQATSAQRENATEEPAAPMESTQVSSAPETVTPTAEPNAAVETLPPATATPVPTQAPVVPTMEVEEETEIIADAEEIGVGSIGF